MQTGHFYFGKNRTFLNWLDKVQNSIDTPGAISYTRARPDQAQSHPEERQFNEYHHLRIARL
jgi:hypothetical protein